MSSGIAKPVVPDLGRRRTERSPFAQAAASERPGQSGQADVVEPKVSAVSKGVLLTLPEDLKDRMMATITWTAPHTGINTQQGFMRRALAELCARLEVEYNHGEPFARPAGGHDS